MHKNYLCRKSCNRLDYYRPQRSWAKVIFSQACVKNSVHRGGRGGLPQCMLGYPPGTRHTPPRADTTTPPGTRHTTPPRDQAHPPLQSRHPPGPGTPPEQTPPPGKQTAAYGQRAAGTHPTGMHSC